MTVMIDPQFNGPPDSGNGGYVAGLVGDLLGPAGSIMFETSLKAPPPLGQPLQVSRDEKGVALMEGETPVAIGHLLTDLDLALPAFAAPVDGDQIVSLVTGFTKCFVCGTDRHEGDGLCVHAGRQPAPSDQWVAPFTVDAAFCDDEGVLERRFLISALDCPGYAAVSSGSLAVLARFRVAVEGHLNAGDTAHVYAWPLSIAGRKMLAGTALVKEGQVIAKAEALWIKISTDQLRAAS